MVILLSKRFFLQQDEGESRFSQFVTLGYLSGTIPIFLFPLGQFQQSLEGLESWQVREDF